MKPGQRAVSGQLDQPLEPDRLLDLGTLAAGPLVVPEDRGPQHAITGVERHEAVHLAAEADPCGSPARRAAVEHRLGRLPPVLGVLLGPARLRRGERVARLGAREHCPVGCDRERP